MKELRIELEKLLSGKDEVFNKKNIWIWGTGNTTSLYLEGIGRLEDEGYIFQGFTDNNEKKWGTMMAGKPIVSPMEIIPTPDVMVLISTPRPEIIHLLLEQTKEMGLFAVPIDEFVFKTHKDDVLKCFDLLDDTKSKEIFVEIIKCRINGAYPHSKFVDTNQYFTFRDFGDSDGEEVFVDCGAYVGDSIETYIWKKVGIFKKIIAFEPDKINIKAANLRISRLKEEWNIPEDKIVLHPYGVGDIESKYYLDRCESNNGLGSKMNGDKTEEAEECRVVTLDSFIVERVSFIKADIEGFEYKMLLGAQNTLNNYSPRLAICNYHNSIDFYSIPLLIHKINPRYKLALRHYTHDLSESVIYAYTEDERYV